MPKPATQRKPAPASFDANGNDIVGDMLAAVVQIWPDLEPEKLELARRQILDRWGGAKIYVGRKLGEGRNLRDEAIQRDYRNGERVPLLMRRYNLSRARIHAILSMPAPVEADAPA